MSTKEQQQYLEQQIEQLRKRFKRDSNRHKRLALILKALTVSLAGAVTVLLGWKVHAGATPQFVGNIALALGASITLVSAYEAFFDPRVLWVRETVVVARLTDLQRDLSYATKGAKDDDLDAATLL
ncbi:MAG TPA: DUF4231 domain-containing protein, partial [Candidatus Angelobacter sp.]|nr:DUF4231 domain-containing protein [Candidatus Angelobacter sp.]